MSVSRRMIRFSGPFFRPFFSAMAVAAVAIAGWTTAPDLHAQEPGSLHAAHDPSSAGRLVQTEEQFIFAMKQHRKKVGALAEDILKRYPDLFPEVKPEHLRAYIALVHDRGKLEPDMAKELFKYWNTDISRLPDAQRSIARALIDDLLNGAEKKMANQFFANYRVSPPGVRQMEAIEKLADGIDRWGAKLSLEEFARSSMRPTSEFLDKSALTQVALHYEANGGALYSRVTRGMHYEDLIPSRASGAGGLRGAPPAAGCLAQNLEKLASLKSPAGVGTASVHSARLKVSQDQMLDYIENAGAAGRINLAEKKALQSAVREGVITQEELRSRVFRTQSAQRLQNNGSGTSPASLEAASRMRRYETYVELPNGQRKLIQEVASEDAWTVNGSAYLRGYPRGTKLIRRDRNSGITTTLETRP